MASAVHGDGGAVDGARVRRQGPSGHSSARAAGAASTARSAGGANPTPSTKKLFWTVNLPLLSSGRNKP